jgi:aminopeptidase N
MRFVCFFVAIVLFQSAYSQEDGIEHVCAQGKKSKTHFVQAQKTLTTTQELQANKFDVTFYDLQLQLTNQNTNVSGTAFIHGKITQALDSLILELFPSHTITNLTLNGISTSYHRNASVLTVPNNLSVGATFVLEIQYNGIPPTPNTNPFGGSGVSCSTVSSINDKVTFTVSCPFLAHEWFPCKQILKDKADSCAVTLTVPSNCIGTSNGMLEQVQTNGNGTKTYYWKHHSPILYYLICAHVAPYTEYTVYAHPAAMQGDSIPIQNFVYGNATGLPQAIAQCDLLPGFLEHYSEKYGLYPFKEEKYGQCLAPLGGGMEHQTMTTMGVNDKRITAHELAHSWWGDAVGIASFSDVWLSEGFATYSEYVMLENFYPAEKASLLAGWHNSVLSSPGGSVFHTDTLNINRIYSSRLSYKKGASIIHTLRHVVNDDALFFASLSTFLAAYKDTVATGQDFRVFMENELGINLVPFFDQWYTGEGYPTFSTQRNVIGNDLLIDITHTVSMPAITPFFTVPLEIRFSRTTGIDTTIRFEIAGPYAQFILPGLANVNDVVSIDPNNWLVNRVGTNTYNPDLTVGMDQTHVNDGWKYYPNPTMGNVTIQPPNALNTPYTVRILSMDGREIQAYQALKGETELSLTHLCTGSYWVELTVSDTRMRKILFKQ